MRLELLSDRVVGLVYAGLTARPALAAEGGVLAGLLRRDFRWRALGLGEPPDETFLAQPVAVAWPQAREARVAALLVLHGERLQAVVLHWGWEPGDERVRIAELVPLELARAADAARVALALLGQERARAVRLPEGGQLDLAWAGAHLPLVAAAGRSYRHLDGAVLRGAAHPCSARELPAVGLAPREARRFSLLAHRRVGPPRFPVDVRNPASAHWELLRSGRPQRRLWCARDPRVEEHEIIVVGGGLAGLAAAYALRDREVLLLERDDRLGGTAASAQGLRGPFPLGAHYECDLPADLSPELLAVYRDLGATRPARGRETFVDEQHYVPEERSEQAVLASGAVRRDGWRHFYSDPEAMRLRELMVAHLGSFPLPSRLAPARAKALDAQTFRAWCDAHGVAKDRALAYGLNVLLRSDYGAPDDVVSAFAGVHYFACRPYLTSGSRTFAPPEGLMYFGERLVRAAKRLTVHTDEMARELVDLGDSVEVTALDRKARSLRTYRARGVVFAAPKKALPYIFPPDRRLFVRNRYAAWITVTLELADLPERDLLCWSNHVYEPSGRYVGFTWANRHTPEAPPVLTHYLAFPPGKREHARALFATPQGLVRLCLRQLAAVVGRDVSDLVERATVQKLGHAMPTPVPGALFFEPNLRRRTPRIVYAGVDTGRLPLLAEALDSGLEAARTLLEALD